MQLDFLSTIFFNNLRTECKPFAIKILSNLYTNSTQGLNIEEIYFLFNNKHKNLIRETISKLEEMFLIRQIKTSRTEKRYTLTEFGETKVLDFYNS